VDGEVRCPSLEMPGGEDQDLLQHLFANMRVEHPTSSVLRVGISEPGDAGAAGDHVMEETGAADAVRNASSAYGPVVSVSAVAPITLFAESLMERWIVLPFVECSTRYAILRFLPHHACW
jgi:hypothetical protein